MTTIAESLRERALKSKLSDSEIARLTIDVDGKGMTRSFISLFLRGDRSITIDRAEVLAAALGLKMHITKPRKGK